jgi:hypothetical protein
MIHTKAWYQNPTVISTIGQEPMDDVGYSNPIPWNPVTTAGWYNPNTMNMWNRENVMVMRDDPEYFAPGDIIRSNVLPEINVQDPIFKFDRSKFEFRAY